MVTCRYPDAEPCAWASYGALGEFCQSRGIWKPNYKSFALLFPLRCLHRRNRPMAAGNLFLRIRIKFSFTHRHADMLTAFQAKRLSSSVLYDRVRNDTAFCGGAALRQPLSPSGYPCITGAVRLPDYSRYRYTFYHP